MCKKLLAIALLSLATLSLNAADIKTALVIGNDAYQVAPLLNSVNDAKSVAKELTQLGFKVDLLTNASYSQMSAAMDRFANTVSGSSNAVALVYFSGHGLQHVDRNLLLGTDVTKDAVDSKSVDIQKILASIRPGMNSSYFVVLDACRQYTLSDNKKGLAPIDAPPGTLIAFSTSPGRVASDGDVKDGNGVYTKYFVKHLKTPGAPVETIFKKVRASVLAETSGEQIPWENSSMLRDFYFLGAPSGSLRTPVESFPSETNTGGSVSRLSSFYDGLARLKNKAFVSANDLQAINGILKPSYGIEISAAEAKYLADKVITVGAWFRDLPAFVAEKYGIQKGLGLQVVSVETGGISDRLGVRMGDIIIEVNGKGVHGLNEALEMQKKLIPGETLTVTALREGEELKLSVVVERTSPAELILALANEKYAMEKNMEKAKTLTQALAEKEHPRAMGLVASYALQPSLFGNSEKQEVGAMLAKKAADLGDDHGIYLWIQSLHSGKGVKEDKTAATELLKKHVDLKQAWAFGVLAWRYLKGDGVSQDYQKAREYAERAAYLGSFDGIGTLGEIYESGLGVEKNVNEAVTWYQRAKEMAGPNKQMRDVWDFKIRAAKNVLGGFGVLLDTLSGKK